MSKNTLRPHGGLEGISNACKKQKGRSFDRPRDENPMLSHTGLRTFARKTGVGAICRVHPLLHRPELNSQ